MMDVDLATNSFGQNLNVTMAQMVATFASLINGGYYYQPHVVKQILSESGEPVKTINPTLVTQTVSSDTSHTMREMMRAVVDYGTGGYVHMDGYSIGGKTGTAQVGNGSNNAVFIAFAPFDDPQIAVSVVLEHGVRGTNAAQVAKDIFDKYFNLDSADATAEPTTATDVQGGLLR